MSKSALTEPAKLLLLVTLLSKDHIISVNGKTFIKELIIRRDPRLAALIETFEKRDSVDMSFLEQIHDLIGTEAQVLYNELFADTSLETGKTLSKREREDRDLNDEKSLIYGEVEFESFYRILRKINPAPGGLFYDLGSGTGKALFVARLTRDFRACIGIEILESLHEEAVRIVGKYNQSVRPLLALELPNQANVHVGSFTSVDWSDGDLVFANSTCFSDELMHAITIQAAQLKPGAILVTFTKGLTSSYFELLERKRYRMSWGPATVFIHRRLNHDSTPYGPVTFNILPSDANTYVEDGESVNVGVTNQLYATLNEVNNKQQHKVEYEDDDIDEDNDDDEEDDDEPEEEEEEPEEEGEDYDGKEEDDNEDDADDDNDEQDDDEEDDEELYHPSPARPTKPPLTAHSTSTSPLNNNSNGNRASNSQQSTPNKRQNPQDAAEVAFNMLNSPQDTALLMRKRAGGKSNPTSTHVSPPTKGSMDGYDNEEE